MRRFLLFAVVFTPAAFSQSAEFAVMGGVSRLKNAVIGDLQGTTYSLGDGFRIGFRTTLNTWRFAGHEFGYGYNRSSLKSSTSPQGTGMAIHQGIYNLLAYARPDGAVVRPFAAGGVHFNNYTPPGTSVTSGGGSTKLGYNYGGGIKVRTGDKFAVRVDVHYYQNGKPFSFLSNRSGLISQLEVSAGFGLVI